MGKLRQDLKLKPKNGAGVKRECDEDSFQNQLGELKYVSILKFLFLFQDPLQNVKMKEKFCRYLLSQTTLV